MTYPPEILAEYDQALAATATLLDGLVSFYQPTEKLLGDEITNLSGLTGALVEKFNAGELAALLAVAIRRLAGGASEVNS